MKNDKLPGENEVKISDFRKKLENYWYHYKTHTLIGLVVIFTLIVCTTQILTREKHDFILMYAGPRVVAIQDLTFMEQSLEDIADDYDKNGEVVVAIDDIVMLSKEEREAASEAGAVFDADFINTSMTEFQQQLMVGEIKIYMLSPYMYKQASANDIFMKLSDIFPEMPETAYDEHAISLLETDFGKHYNGINDLPKDTLLCIRRLTDIDKAKNGQKAHEANVDLFRKIVEFVSPDKPNTPDTGKDDVKTSIEYTSKIYRADGYGHTDMLVPFLENAVDFTSGKAGVLAIAHFEGTNKLTRFLEDAGKGYQFNVSYNSETSLADAVKKYDEAFFEDHALIIVHIEEGSGSIRHTVDSAEKLNGRLEVKIARQVPEAGTADMADWFAVIEVEKADIADVIMFSAGIID